MSYKSEQLSSKLNQFIMSLDDQRTTNEFVTEICDDFLEADECDKANIFIRCNYKNLREFNCPREWLQDLEEHGVIKKFEAEEFGHWPIGKYRLSAMMTVIKTRNMWPKIPVFIELIRPYHAEVANIMKERYDELCKLVC